MGPLDPSGREPARHSPLANPDRADTVLIRVRPSRARAGPARPVHLAFGHLYLGPRSLALSHHLICLTSPGPS